MTDYTERLNDAFITLEAATSGQSSPAKNLATSITWSMCGQIANLMTGLVVLDDPDNPNRPRSPDALVEQIHRMERMIEERQYVLGIVGRMASPELLPDLKQFVEPRGTFKPNAAVTAEDLAALFDQPVEMVGAVLRDEQAKQAKVQDLKDKRLGDDEVLRRSIVGALKNALFGYPEITGDIDPRLAGRIFERMAEKLDAQVARNIARASRTSRLRLRTELAAQTRVIQAAMDTFDSWVESANQEIENNTFDVERAVMTAHENDHRFNLETVEVD